MPELEKPHDLLRGRVVVVSPHLDDAVLSLGASIVRATRSGAFVTVLTVLAGDPDSELPAGPWDELCGFATAGDAARERRREEARACAILGAAAECLRFPDDQYERTATDEEVWSAVEPHLLGTDVVLLPGHPLTNVGHAWLTRLVLGRAAPDSSIALYVEQPYASWLRFGHGPVRVVLRSGAMRISARRRSLSLPVPDALAGLVRAVEWRRRRASLSDRRAKQLAIRAYSSQIPHLGRRLRWRITMYEAAWGGEGIGIPVLAPLASRQAVSSRDRARAAAPSED